MSYFTGLRGVTAAPLVCIQKERIRILPSPPIKVIKMKKEKILIVTTAASRYLENKQADSKQNNWVMTGRQELINNELRP